MPVALSCEVPDRRRASYYQEKLDVTARSRNELQWRSACFMFVMRDRRGGLKPSLVTDYYF
jgi:hypothetical protein